MQLFTAIITTVREQPVTNSPKRRELALAGRDWRRVASFGATEVVADSSLPSCCLALLFLFNFGLQILSFERSVRRRGHSAASFELVLSFNIEAFAEY